jgi:hypothetical protein
VNEATESPVIEAWGDILGREGATYHKNGTAEPVHRYRLWRVWDHTVQICLFVMLNPSTATEHKLDPTVRKCVGYAQRWGYGGLVVCNLYAYRATKPRDMAAAEDPVGPLNDNYLTQEAARAGRIVCAWGANKGPVDGRAQHVTRLLRDAARSELYALRLCKGGEPEHPLYIPKAVVPVVYDG